MLMQDHLAYWALRTPGQVCIQDGVLSYTYAELDEASDAFAAGLTSRGYGKGDRIACVAKNTAEWAVLYFGSFKAGVVLVPLNFRLHPAEWLYQLQNSGARAVLAQAAYVPGLGSVLTGQPRVCIDGVVPGWEELAAWKTPGVAPDVDVVPADELYQMYTSGTTGRPKGAIITHSSADANIAQARTAMPVLPGENVLMVMPLFHAGAAVGFLCNVASGGTTRVLNEFVPADVVRILDEDGITQVALVPAMVQALLVTVPGVADRSYDKLRLIGYGAAPIAEQTLRTAMKVFGCEFLQVYGQTESSAGITMLNTEDHDLALEGRPELLQSCGRAILGTHLKIVDGEGAELPTGEVGEILAKGPQMMQGYWALPEVTAAALAGGWLHTGDLGRVDADGYLYVVDRAKDMIVSGGENIYSKQIEDVLYLMPGVVEAAVIGVPDERWGESVKAFVVGGVTADDVQAFCRGHLAGYKIPSSVEVVGPLPRTASGKVLKHVLREPYWAGHTRRVG